MSKTPKQTRKVYVATQTIHRGSPDDRETIAPGEVVDGLSDKDAKVLLERGIIRAEAARGGAAAAAEGEETPPPGGEQQ